MLTLWPDFEIGWSVVVEFTAIWLIRPVVEMLASAIISARHTTAYSSRSFWHCWGHFDAQCRRIHRTQSCSISICHQFHPLSLSFNSRQRHYHQHSNYRQNVCWRHRFVWRRQRQRKDYLPRRRVTLRYLGVVRSLVVDDQLKLRSWLRVWALLLSDRVTTDNTVSDRDLDDVNWVESIAWRWPVRKAQFAAVR